MSTITLAGMTAHQIAEAVDAGTVTRTEAKAHLAGKAKLRPPSRRLLDALTHTRTGSVVAALSKRDTSAKAERDAWLAERKAEADAKKRAKTARAEKPATKPRAQAKPVADDVTKRMDRIEATLAQLIDALTGARASK